MASAFWWGSEAMTFRQIRSDLSSDTCFGVLLELAATFSKLPPRLLMAAHYPKLRFGITETQSRVRSATPIAEPDPPALPAELWPQIRSPA